jgi:hypothetical protein
MTSHRQQVCAPLLPRRCTGMRSQGNGRHPTSRPSKPLQYAQSARQFAHRQPHASGAHPCRILHYNVTAHPTADWTLQQFREAIPSDYSYKFLIHDRHSIFSRELDKQLESDFKLKVLRTPVRAPKANAYCKRLIGRPHSSLGPGIPENVSVGALFRPKVHGHKLPRDCEIRAMEILGGLHHEYWLEHRVA